MRLSVYYKFWIIVAKNSLQETFVNRWSNVLFITGKLLRLVMALFFLWLIQTNVKQFGAYSSQELVIFFLTYHWIDLLSQVFFRGVYMFRQQVVNGEFDLTLVKPIHPLFQALTGKPDINDAIFLIPSMIATYVIIQRLGITFELNDMLWFGVLFLNGFLIATALHIWVLIIGILTTAVDGIIWLYRDLLELGQFPISVYREPMRFLLFFFVPIGLMTTIPAEILTNHNPSFSLPIVFGAGISFFVVTLKAWGWALKRYSSASS